MGQSLHDELASNIEDLRTRYGFRMTSNLYAPEAFGNAIVTLESSSLRLRLIRDRGEANVEVASADAINEWHSLNTVLEALGVLAATDTGPSEWAGQFDLLLNNLERIKSILQEPGRTALRHFEKRKAQQRIAELSKDE